ncbi:MAG: aldehyde dehydrogenase family protein, partial [Pseudomonadota bacterium]
MDTIDTSHMRLKLNDPDLFRTKAYINGEWVAAGSGATFEVTNPATGEAIGTVPDMGPAETERAIDAAKEAWPAWRQKTAKERGAILQEWRRLMLDNQEDLARLMTLEQGKPLAEAKGEV